MNKTIKYSLIGLFIATLGISSYLIYKNLQTGYGSIDAEKEALIYMILVSKGVQNPTKKQIKEYSKYSIEQLQSMLQL